MPDSKITALTSIGTGTDPANDPLVIVDVSDVSPGGMSATGTTKKVTLNNLLSSSPTATGNFTITGDLTVRTAGLTVNANGVGVGVVGTLGAGNIQISAGKYLGYSASAYITPEDNVQGARFKADNILIDGNTSTKWNIGGTSAMTLNSTGLAVGTTAQYARFTATGSNSTGIANIQNSPFASNANTNLSCYIGHDGTVNRPFIQAATGNSGNAFDLLIQPYGGNLLVGTTSALASGSTFQNLGSARQVLTLKNNDSTSYTLGLWSATTTGDNFFAYFGTETTLTVRGAISYNRAGGLVAYNTTSDYRAKDIIGPVSNSGSLIDSLKVYVGKMKGATVERPMLIAHEAQDVAPYAVTGTKDEVDADGNPKYQQMDVSSLVPLLIAEIQSLRTRVAALEA